MSKKSKKSKKSKILQRLVRRVTKDGHEDEAKALKIVDCLMRAYGFTKDPLYPDVNTLQFSSELRQLVREWESQL